MTDSFVTQCPHCQTRFRVTHHQLGVARGVVRCGQCLEVFNAARQLLEQSRAADSSSAVEAAPLPIEPIPVQADVVEAPTEPFIGEDNPLPAEAEPAAPVDAAAPSDARADDWTRTAQALDELDLDQALANLERRSSSAPVARVADTLQARREEQAADSDDETPFGTANDHDHDHADHTLDEPDSAVGEVDVKRDAYRQDPVVGDAIAIGEAEHALGDLADDGAPSLSATDLDHGRDEEADAPVLKAGLTADDEVEPYAKGLSATHREPAVQSLSAQDDVDDDRLTLPQDGRQEPSLQAGPSRTPRALLVDVVDDPLQLDWQPPAPNWGKRLLWLLLILLAALALVGQYLRYHFDEMARHDRWRPVFLQVCPLVGCQVPTRVDVSRIKSSNLVVRSHPDFKGALIVDAILYNRAPFSQPFPLLELRFADLNGQLIASRRFKPSEYLSGELAGRGEMPSQTPIHIALDILDPGPKAVNYSLSFRSPE